MNYIAALLLALAVVLTVSNNFFLGVSAQVDPEECVFCEFLVQYAESYLSNNYTVSVIVQRLELVCSLAPQPFRDQCDAFLATNVVALINLLIESENPATVCLQLNLCHPPPSSN
jgi:hypothetical protein